jgi:hypothetical protein
MPKDVYESLSLWKLSEGGEEISLTNNATIFPVGIVEGVSLQEDPSYNNTFICI